MIAEAIPDAIHPPELYANPKPKKIRHRCGAVKIPYTATVTSMDKNKFMTVSFFITIPPSVDNPHQWHHPPRL